MIGTILLDQEDRYLIDGTLPKRPVYDKQLLAELINTHYITPEGGAILPTSLKATARFNKAGRGMLGIRIQEVAESSVLLVSRTRDARKGSYDKKFRLDNFVKLEGVEIWLRVK